MALFPLLFPVFLLNFLNSPAGGRILVLSESRRDVFSAIQGPAGNAVMHLSWRV